MRISLKNIIDRFLAFGGKTTRQFFLKVYILYNVHQLKYHMDNHNSTLAIIRPHDATINEHHIMHKTCSKLMGECMKDKDLYCH
jgi:hypothetical protein